LKNAASRAARNRRAAADGTGAERKKHDRGSPATAAMHGRRRIVVLVPLVIFLALVRCFCSGSMPAILRAFPRR
jgi:hypothetical protein